MAGSSIRSVNFREMLSTEFEQRRRNNPRYSLRAFARYLGTDHSTLSQILRNRRNLSPRMIRRFGGRLRLKPAIITDACVQQNAETILRLARSPSFSTHSRWIAARTNLPLDAVNAALHRLLHQGDLLMESTHRWKTTRAPYA
jgi:transcriptional regulator with XRE-family HTH domain